jgi:hypothetical protein
MRRQRSTLEVLARALLGGMTGLGFAACTEQAEPRAAPVVARRLGGDSIQPGPMIVVCRPEDEGCVPTYAVFCPEPGAAESSRTAQVAARPLSLEEEAWCAANAAGSAETR